MTRLARAALLLLLAACGSSNPAPVGISDGRALLAARKAAGGETPAAGHMVAFVSERSIGPFMARRGRGNDATGMVAWLSEAEAQNRRVVAIPLSSTGAPRGAEKTIAYVSVDTTTLVVKPVGGATPGFLVAWTSLTDRGKSLWVIALGDDGSVRAKPVELTRTNDDIVWVDVLPTEKGAVCFWTEETRGGDANLLAAPLDPDGRVRGNATRVAQGISGWHALELPDGVGISTVIPPSPDKAKPDKRLLRDTRPGGTLSFVRLDAEAHPTKPPITIVNKPTVSGDVEVTRADGKLVFAWTDRSTDEPSLAIAALSDRGEVTPPRKLAEARGGASLLALESGNAGVAVMFEAPTRRRGETRRIHVARVGDGLALDGKPFSLDVVGRGQPELATTNDGFAVLATTANCEADSPACVSAQAVATVFRTDAKLGLLQREPLTFQTDPATLGWGMRCDGETCLSLAASPGPAGAPSRIRTAVVHARANAKTAPVAIQPPSDAPHATELGAIASGESIVDITSAHFGDTALVALLSAPPSAKGDKRDPRHDASETTLSTRIVGEDGKVGAANVISTRALPVGGIAIAQAEKPEDGGAIAWVARENGDPEVHVTRIDKRGRRTNDVQLTTTKGDAANVTLTWAHDGWIVAWVDGRDGNGEVYATKVTTELQRIAREERITNAPGDASDLVALARGDNVWLAWADSRDSPRDGVADIFVSAVKMHDAKRAFADQRVLATAAHSRSPRLSPGESGVAIAWIEEAPMGAETPTTSGYGAFWARLDVTGKVLDRPTKIPLAGEGAATSVALDGMRAVVARSTTDSVAIDAIDLARGGPGTLVTLDGPPSLDVALVLDRDVLYFNDEGPRASDRRARRAKVVWSAK